MLRQRSTGMNIDDEGPFAREPYSADTILADLMIDPAARALLDRLAPDLLRAPRRSAAGRCRRGWRRSSARARCFLIGSRGRPPWSRSSTVSSRRSS